MKVGDRAICNVTNNWFNAGEWITHIDKYDNLWSGNFRGWIQFRQLLKSN